MQTTFLSKPTQGFWDRIAHKYARKPVADQAAYEEKLSRLKALFRPSDRILEIGCGTGSTALRVASDVAHITATDISRTMIEIAQTKLGADGPGNVSFRQADAMDSIENQPFDAICAFSLLHLVQDLPTVLNRVRDQLQPGGLFISKTVCLKNGSVFLRIFVAALTAMGLAPQVAALSTDDVIEVLKRAGFEVTEVRYFGAGRMNPFIVAQRSAA